MTLSIWTGISWQGHRTRSERAIFVLLCLYRNTFDNVGSRQLAETSIRDAEARSGAFVRDSTPSRPSPWGSLHLPLVRWDTVLAAVVMALALPPPPSKPLFP